MRVKNKQVKILKIKAKDYKRIAKAPLFSKLSNKILQKILKTKLSHWKVGVDQYIRQI